MLCVLLLPKLSNANYFFDLILTWLIKTLEFKRKKTISTSSDLLNELGLCFFFFHQLFFISLVVFGSPGHYGQRVRLLAAEEFKYETEFAEMELREVPNVQELLWRIETATNK